ncbi:DEAD/DEAH box helicase [Clostridium sp.]|uniref:DEAD/DEAH box helicase n=1 Tax=Clostridium sp. TaxID=1506 RepID=UPI0034649031
MIENDFEKLAIGNDIVRALSNLGFTEAKEVQKKVIPFMLSSKDIIVKSETGSGKTASFGIPLCEKVEVEDNKVQGIVLTPTRELALQVKEEISNIGRIKKVRCAAIFGKQPMKEQINELKQRIHIVAGTPGRVIDHIERGTINLESAKYLIIDEGDKMLNMGFIDQIEKVINALPKDKNIMLFSATMPEAVEKLCLKYMKAPEKITVVTKVVNRERIEEVYYNVEDRDKFKALKRVIYGEVPNRGIVFCNTKEKVRAVIKLMKDEDISAKELHGDMEQKERLRIMEDFKDGRFQFLVSTDIAARGIHVDDITHVINYDVPGEKEAYVHRIGRTGRQGKSGKAITFVSSYEIKYLKAIEEYIGYALTHGEYVEDSKLREGKKLLKEKSMNLKKSSRPKNINKDIVKIHLNGGKKKKIRPGDIVGALNNIEGITTEDIGIIEVQDGFSYVDILNKKGNILLNNYKELSIKGKSIKIQRAKS